MLQTPPTHSVLGRKGHEAISHCHWRSQVEKASSIARAVVELEYPRREGKARIAVLHTAAWPAAQPTSAITEGDDFKDEKPYEFSALAFCSSPRGFCQIRCTISGTRKVATNITRVTTYSESRKDGSIPRKHRATTCRDKDFWSDVS